MCQGHFFNKVADLKPAIVLKKSSRTCVFYDIWSVFKNTEF